MIHKHRTKERQNKNPQTVWFLHMSKWVIYTLSNESGNMAGTNQRTQICRDNTEVNSGLLMWTGDADMC